MNHWLRIIGASLVSSAIAASAISSPNALKTGDPLPTIDFTLKNTDGVPTKISPPNDKGGLLIVFYSHASSACRAWEQRILTAAKLLQEKGGTALLVNPNNPKLSEADRLDSMAAYVKGQGVELTFLADEDGKLAKLLGATRTPEAYLFDPKAKLVYHGTVDDNPQYPDSVKFSFLKDAVTQLNAGQRITVSKTIVPGDDIIRK